MGLLLSDRRPSGAATPQTGFWKGALHGLRRRWRSEHRALPQFLIIGAPKAGTTSLYRYLAQHPQVLEARRKEVHYFDIHYARGEAWYRSHFPTHRELGDRGITGEGSPYYLCHPQSPPRMAALLPDARIIVLLRNPVERAISHYFHSLRNKREPLSIEAAMAAEEDRTAAVFEQMRRDPRAESKPHRYYAYKGMGHYRDQLEIVFEHYPQEQVLIFKSDDLFSDPQRVLSESCRHIGIDADFRATNLEPQLVGGYEKDRAASVRASLHEYFAPRNAALCDLLGRNLGWESP
jgi:hypothetical protein